MAFKLAPGVHVCQCEGDVVVLDVRRNRYLALAGRTADAAIGARDGLAPFDETLAERLIGMGLLVRYAGTPGRQRLPASERSAQPWGDDDAVDLATRAMALGRMVAAMLELRSRRLSSILGSLARTKAQIARNEASGARARTTAAAFKAADLAITPLNRCLPRSVAIMRSMLAARCSADLVIGVKLHPFQAHCWVQSEGRLVGETEANVSPFTPLLQV